MTWKIRLKTSNHIRNLPQPLPIIRFISGQLFHHNISFSKKDFDFFYEFSTEIMNTYSCTLICLFIVSKCKGCYFFILSFCHYQIRSTSGPHIKSIIFFDGIFSVVFFLFFFASQFNIADGPATHISHLLMSILRVFVSANFPLFYFGFFSWHHHTENSSSSSSSSSRAALFNHDLWM